MRSPDFSKHRLAFLAGLFLCLGLSLFLLCRLRLDDGIIAFFPDAERESRELAQFLALAPSSQIVFIDLEGDEAESFGQELEERFRQEDDLELISLSKFQTVSPQLVQTLLPFYFDAKAEEQLRRLLSPESLKASLEDDKRLLSGLAGGLAIPWVRGDPLQLRRLLLERFASYKESLSFIHDRHYLLMVKVGKGVKVALRIESLIKNLRLPEGIELTASGGPLYTAANSRAIEHDISWIASLALVGFALTYLIFVRSLGAIWILLAPVIATLVGSAGLAGLWPAASGLALGFGASLMGLSEDYAVHMHFALRAEKKGWSQVITPLLQSWLLNSVGFFVLLFSSVPALRQLAFFSLLSLAAGFFYAVFSLPALPWAGKPALYPSKSDSASLRERSKEGTLSGEEKREGLREEQKESAGERRELSLFHMTEAITEEGKSQKAESEVSCSLYAKGDSSKDKFPQDLERAVLASPRQEQGSFRLQIHALHSKLNLQGLPLSLGTQVLASTKELKGLSLSKESEGVALVKDPEVLPSTMILVKEAEGLALVKEAEFWSLGKEIKWVSSDVKRQQSLGLQASTEYTSLQSGFEHTLFQDFSICYCPQDRWTGQDRWTLPLLESVSARLSIGSALPCQQVDSASCLLSAQLPLPSTLYRYEVNLDREQGDLNREQVKEEAKKEEKEEIEAQERGCVSAEGVVSLLHTTEAIVEEGKTQRLRSDLSCSLYFRGDSSQDKSPQDSERAVLAYPRQEQGSSRLYLSGLRSKLGLQGLPVILAGQILVLASTNDLEELSSSKEPEVLPSSKEIEELISGKEAEVLPWGKEIEWLVSSDVKLQQSLGLQASIEYSSLQSGLEHTLFQGFSTCYCPQDRWTLPLLESVLPRLSIGSALPCQQLETASCLLSAQLPLPSTLYRYEVNLDREQGDLNREQVKEEAKKEEKEEIEGQERGCVSAEGVVSLLHTREAIAEEGKTQRLRSELSCSLYFRGDSSQDKSPQDSERAVLTSPRQEQGSYRLQLSGLHSKLDLQGLSLSLAGQLLASTKELERFPSTKEIERVSSSKEPEVLSLGKKIEWVSSDVQLQQSFSLQTSSEHLALQSRLSYDALYTLSLDRYCSQERWILPLGERYISSSQEVKASYSLHSQKQEQSPSSLAKPERLELGIDFSHQSRSLQEQSTLWSEEKLPQLETRQEGRHAFSSLWQYRFQCKHRIVLGRVLAWLLLFVIVALLIGRNLRLEFSPKKLGYETEQLAAQAEKIRTVWGKNFGRSIVIQAASEEALLARCVETAGVLRKAGIVVRSPSDVLLPANEQEVNRLRWQSFWKEEGLALREQIEDAGRVAGFSASLFASLWEEPKKHGSLKESLHELGLSTFLNLFLFEAGAGQYAVLSLVGNATKEEVLALIGKDALFVEEKGAEEEIHSLLRKELRLIPSTVLFCLLLLFVCLRRPVRVLLVCLPAIGSILAVLLVFWFLDLPLLLTALCSFPITIGLSLDHGIMMSHALETGKELGIQRAILVSSLTAFVSMGLLAFALHPALQAMGIVIFTGLVSELFLSLFLLPSCCKERNS